MAIPPPGHVSVLCLVRHPTEDKKVEDDRQIRPLDSDMKTNTLAVAQDRRIVKAILSFARIFRQSCRLSDTVATRVLRWKKCT